MDMLEVTREIVVQASLDFLASRHEPSAARTLDNAIRLHAEAMEEREAQADA